MQAPGQYRSGAIEHLLVTHSHSTITMLRIWNAAGRIAHGLQHPMHIYGNGTVMHHTRAAIGRFEGQRYQFHLLRPYETFAMGDARVTPLLADRPDGNLSIIRD